MIDQFVPLLGSFLTSGIMQYCIFPIFGVAFISFIPQLLKYSLHRS